MRSPAESPGATPQLSHAARLELERRLGHTFRDPERLARALTHSSRAHEEGDTSGGNERLEFLGDAVLDLVISERLMDLRPEAREGVLSRARAAAVNQSALAAHALALGLDRHVRLGRGEDHSGGRHKLSILANVFEAVLGALYLDGGLPAVHTLVDRELGAALLAPAELVDAKTRLQERLQKDGRPLPRYVHARGEGPDHAPEFQVEALSGEEVLGRGCGRSKREAEQAAAAEALERLDT